MCVLLEEKKKQPYLIFFSYLFPLQGGFSGFLLDFTVFLKYFFGGFFIFFTFAGVVIVHCLAHWDTYSTGDATKSPFIEEGQA